MLNIRFASILYTLGVFLMIFSLSMWPPIFIAFQYRGSGWVAFFLGFLATFGTGFFLWFPLRRVPKELRVRDGFLIVALFWMVLGSFAALPLMIVDFPHLSFTDALFEAISGLTTTGASVITDIDNLPYAILFYRQQLQFLGGMGIVVLAVAILPMLGIGGLQLYQAETSGLAKNNKLTPRIAQTAKALWSIYVGLTLLCAIAYRLAGMTWFDALCESFGTISTGGYSIHSNSFSYYNSAIIEAIAIIFMILGSINFSLHFFALQRRSFTAYWNDHELRAFLKVLLLITLISMSVLMLYQIYSEPQMAWRHAIFNTVSMATTTGYFTDPFYKWPTFLPVLLLLSAMMGGCAASTTGGVKILRVLLLYRQGVREVKRLIHPNATLTIKLGKQILSESVVQSVWGFMGVYLGLCALIGLVLMALGMDIQSAFGSLIAAIANAGVGLGVTADTFGNISDHSKWVLIFAMLAGRLEIFTLLVLLSPAFWRP